MAMDDPRVQVVLLLYRCRRVGGELRAGDDAIDARFFPIDRTPPDTRVQSARAGARGSATRDLGRRLFEPGDDPLRLLKQSSPANLSNRRGLVAGCGTRREEVIARLPTLARTAADAIDCVGR